MRPLTIFLTAAAFAVVFGFFGWAFYETRDFGSWTGGSVPLALIIAMGVFGTGGLTALLMWLAFYSSRKGFDEEAYNFSLEEEAKRGSWRDR